MEPYKWVLLVMVWIMFLLVGGYLIGKDAAMRDNRIQESCADNPTNCKPTGK